MFKNFLTWLTPEQQQNASPEHSLQLAAAVLLFEIMRADDELHEAELEHFKEVLLQHFVLSTDEINELLEQAKVESKSAVDFYQYTNAINQNCQQAQKVTILESLWRVAYADGKIDAHEEHLIRRMADLLHIPHSSFIKSKLSAEAKSTNSSNG